MPSIDIDKNDEDWFWNVEWKRRSIDIYDASKRRCSRYLVNEVTTRDYNDGQDKINVTLSKVGLTPWITYSAIKTLQESVNVITMGQTKWYFQLDDNIDRLFSDTFSKWDVLDVITISGCYHQPHWIHYAAFIVVKWDQFL